MRGGIQSQQDVEAEAARIRGELDNLKGAADFPVEFLPLAQLRTRDQLAKAPIAGSSGLSYSHFIWLRSGRINAVPP